MLERFKAHLFRIERIRHFRRFRKIERHNQPGARSRDLLHPAIAVAAGLEHILHPEIIAHPIDGQRFLPVVDFHDLRQILRAVPGFQRSVRKRPRLLGAKPFGIHKSLAQERERPHQRSRHRLNRSPLVERIMRRRISDDDGLAGPLVPQRNQRRSTTGNPVRKQTQHSRKAAPAQFFAPILVRHKSSRCTKVGANSVIHIPRTIVRRKILPTPILIPRPLKLGNPVIRININQPGIHILPGKIDRKITRRHIVIVVDLDYAPLPHKQSTPTENTAVSPINIRITKGISPGPLVRNPVRRKILLPKRRKADKQRNRRRQ